MTMTRKNAVILNYTANTYHWGCYGTCVEIYDTLRERGYTVNWLDVRTTHAQAPRPATPKDFDDGKFASRFFQENKPIYHAVTEADVIVVNGEGTLHRINPAPVNLLYLMYACRKFLGKPVHLINHSFFPTGSEQAEDGADSLYRGIAATLTRIVPRETASAAVLQRLGLNATQGFDCLPRFIHRHRFTATPAPEGPLVLSGGVTLSQQGAAKMASALAPYAAAGRKVQFLTGAKSFPAREDATAFEAMRAVLPQLEWVDAPTMEAWLQTLAQASCLISARFHHTIAAATLGTPVISFPSNTPKVPAICAMFGIDAPLSLDAPDATETIRARLEQALGGQAPRARETTLQTILGLAENNFATL